MSYVLVFSIWIHGQIHHHRLHGYDTQGSCVAAVKQFQVEFDLVESHCEPETTQGIK